MTNDQIYNIGNRNDNVKCTCRRDTNGQNQKHNDKVGVCGKMCQKNSQKKTGGITYSAWTTVH